jgi:hypothetical protein
MSYYKYAERDADSQINWAEVGKGISDMLAETNRVRQEKKDALDEAQRETMQYLAETPNGEHVGARQSILEYANMASNQMRIMKQLMEQGQLDVKDYTIFRQNLTDNTNLAFNANKLFQEKYADVMQGVRDKKYSQLYADNFAEVQEFGNWKNIGWQIAPNGVVMAGKMVEQEVDGKKVRTLDKTPGGLRSMDYLNQTMVSQVDFYNYEDKVNAWVDTLGKNTEVSTFLGRIGAQGLSRSLEDVTKKKYAKEGDMEVEYKFIQSENDQIATIVGDPLDAARVLVDSAIFAPNQKQYRTTTSEEDAKKNPEAILKVVDPETGGFKYVISKEQQKDVNEFVRTQMRAKYNKEEKEDVINQVKRDEPRAKTPEENLQANMEKDAQNFALNMANYVSGTDAQKGKAAAYFRGLGINLVSNPPGKPRGNYIRNEKDELVKFESAGDLKSAIRGMAGPLLKQSGKNLPEDMVINFALKNLGKGFNTTWSGTGETVDVDARIASKKSNVDKTDAFKLKNDQALPKLEEILGEVPNIKILRNDGNGLQNFVDITIPSYKEGKKVIPKRSIRLETNNYTSKGANAEKDKLKRFIDKLTAKEKAALAGDTEYRGQTGGTIKGGNTR